MRNLRRYISRQTFLASSVFGVVGLGGLVAMIPVIGTFFGPIVDAPPDVWRDVEAVDQFEVGKTVQVNLKYNLGGPQAWSGATQYTIAWLRRTGGENFAAFADYCTHLSCPVHWLQDPQIFLCPCHGSIFTSDGSVAGGPAARPLFHYRTRVRNGRVEVKTEPIPFATVG